MSTHAIDSKPRLSFRADGLGGGLLRGAGVLVSWAVALLAVVAGGLAYAFHTCDGASGWWCNGGAGVRDVIAVTAIGGGPLACLVLGVVAAVRREWQWLAIGVLVAIISVCIAFALASTGVTFDWG